MPRTKRKDKSRAVLRTGESQRADGTYQFRWTDSNHKRFCVYAKTLDEFIKFWTLNPRDVESGLCDSNSSIKEGNRVFNISLSSLWKDK